MLFTTGKLSLSSIILFLSTRWQNHPQVLRQECLSVSIHIVSAYAQRDRLCLGQVQTGEKSNEITAIPELLELLYLEKATVT